VLQAHRARQVARLDKLPVADRPTAFAAQLERWDRELAADLAPIVGESAAARLAERANGEQLARLNAEALHG
jgi:hypothetical protein